VIDVFEKSGSVILPTWQYWGRAEKEEGWGSEEGNSNYLPGKLGIEVSGSAHVTYAMCVCVCTRIICVEDLQLESASLNSGSFCVKCDPYPRLTGLQRKLYGARDVWLCYTVRSLVKIWVTLTFNFHLICIIRACIPVPILIRNWYATAIVKKEAPRNISGRLFVMRVDHCSRW